MSNTEKTKALKESNNLEQLRDMAQARKIPTDGQTKLQLATAIVEYDEANPPADPNDRAEAMARAREGSTELAEATPAPSTDDELEAARKAAQESEESERDLDRPDPAAAEKGTNVREIPREGRLSHTGRWIPKDVIKYTNKRGNRVRRKPTIFVPGHGEVPNVLDDIPQGIATNLWERGYLDPEMA